MGKKPEDIQKFIQALTIMQIMIPQYLNYSIDYYKRKYAVSDLYKGNVRLITF